jgi:hypothetical protein
MTTSANMNNTSDLAVVDGFCYNLTQSMVLPNQYLPLAMGQLEKVRKAAGLRPKWYSVPEETGLNVIAQVGYYRAKIQVASSSYLIGISVNQDAALISTQLQVKLTEGATGIPIFHNYVDLAAISDSTFLDVPAFYLPEPRLIVEPGWISVEITNLFGGTPIAGVTWLMLLCAEPVVPIKSPQCAVWGRS